MIRKITTMTLLAVVSLGVPLAGAAPAGAQTYSGCQAVLSDITPEPGQTITVTGTGAKAGDVVTATLNNVVIGSGVADTNGSFQFSATIPVGTPTGTATVFVNCGPDGGTLGVVITVGATTAPPLPRTGAGNTIPLLKLGIALIAAGALILALRRRSAWVEDTTPLP